MTDTTISDAVVFAQDDGTGVSDGSEDYSSAAFFSALAKYQGYGSYIGEDNTGSATLQFNDVDTTNEQVDVGTGYAYITESGHTVQSGSQTTYDTTLPVETPYVVMLPSEVVDLGLGTDNVNDLWLAVDPTSNDDVYIRHGNGLSAPTDPNVKLGTVDTSSGATTRANDLSTTSNKSVSTEDLVIGGTLYEEDDNSPINVTETSSTTFTLANPAQQVIIVPDTEGTGTALQGFNNLQVNGDSAANYNYVDNSDTRTTGQSQFVVPPFHRTQYYVIGGLGDDRVTLGIQMMTGQTGITVGGGNLNINPPISQFTFSSGGGTAVDAKARVYRRVMSV